MRAGQELRITLPRQQNRPRGNPTSPGSSSGNPQQQAYTVTIPPGVQSGQQFRVMVNGQNLFVTCPPNARPGSDVRIFPPEPPSTQSQMYEVVVPAGVNPGQPFALVANGQRVLVTCPPNAGPGQKIRFLLPKSLGKEQIDSVKLKYDKEGWSRCLGTDLKFHWYKNETDSRGESKEEEKVSERS